MGKKLGVFLCIVAVAIGVFGAGNIFSDAGENWGGSYLVNSSQGEDDMYIGIDMRSYELQDADGKVLNEGNFLLFFDKFVMLKNGTILYENEDGFYYIQGIDRFNVDKISEVSSLGV